MPHDVTLIATFAVAFVLASIFGYIASRLRLPPLVGYLVAGAVMATSIPGYTADTGIAGQLAEIGVILLMFGVGLHFSLGALLAVRKIAIPGAVVQIVLATLIGAGMSMLWGWSFGAGLILGLALSVASTVVLVKALEERNALSTTNGRIAVGWLIVEDLAMVIVLVILPALAEVLGGSAAAGAHGGESRGLLATLGITILKVAAFAAIALILGPRVMPWILRQVARTGSRELFTLAVLTLSVGIAFGATALFDVSFALGAFFAGMVLNESELSHKAAANSLPLQDAFAVLFFVSVGMLFDPSIIMREPLTVLGRPRADPDRQVGDCARAGGRPRLSDEHRAHDFGRARPGRRVLVHPRHARHRLRTPAQGGPVADRRRRADLDHAEPPGILARRSPHRDVCAHGRSCGSATRSSAAARSRRSSTSSPKRSGARRRRRRATARSIPGSSPSASRCSRGSRPSSARWSSCTSAPRPRDPGERIIRKGDKADAAYFISSGEVEVDVGGRRIRLGPGDCFGEMALISGQPRSAHVTALDYCSLLKLTTGDFREILRRYPEIRAQIADLAAQRGQMNREQVEGDSGSKDATLPD